MPREAHLLGIEKAKSRKDNISQRSMQIDRDEMEEIGG
jgi:hypothetical protein